MIRKELYANPIQVAADVFKGTELIEFIVGGSCFWCEIQEGWPIHKADHQAAQQHKIQSVDGKQAERVVHLRRSSLPKHDNIMIYIVT